jgi:peptidoglycan/LPS O-acetylase OafA/YrhL
MTRVQGIDLLRGIAILLVMLRHGAPAAFPGGGVVGVVMFFALSGYLITGALLATPPGRPRSTLRAFYLRRAARLVPALAVMVAVFSVVTLLLDPLGDRGELARTVVVALTYTADLPFDHGSDALFHLWTLALEEQFYLLWPVVLLVARARGRIRPALTGAGIASAAACGLTLLWAGPEADLLYSWPTSWSGCFVIGSAARVLVERRPGMRARWLPAAAAAACAALMVLALLPVRGHAGTYVLVAPLVSVLTAVALVAWRHWWVVGSWPLQALVSLGTISYGAYLWNYPLTLWMRVLLPGPGGIALAATLTIVLALASWHLIERPLMRLRRTPARTRPGG